MPDINRLVLTGRIVQEPERHTTDSGLAILRFRIASNTYAGPNRENTLFLDCVVFGTRAESLAPLLHKGMRVATDGSLVLRSWVGADGARRNAYSLHVDRLSFLDRKNGEAPEPVVPPPSDEEVVPF